ISTASSATATRCSSSEPAHHTTPRRGRLQAALRFGPHRPTVACNGPLRFLHTMERTTIIVAGGSGKRLGGPVPKQFQTVNGRPLLMWTITAFHRFDPTMPLIVVLPREHFDIWRALCMGHRFQIDHQVVAG